MENLALTTLLLPFIGALVVSFSPQRRAAEWEGFAARVTHDGTGWTVEARVRLTAEDRQRGYALGNVSRWRVGDRRRPQEERVPGSRYEHSRLGTVFTNDNDDPAAFVSFLL